MFLPLFSNTKWQVDHLLLIQEDALLHHQEEATSSPNLVVIPTVQEEEVHHHLEEEIVADLVIEDADHRHRHVEIIDLMTIDDHAISKAKLMVFLFYQARASQISMFGLGWFPCAWKKTNYYFLFLISRTRVRNQSTKTIWARSPERPTRSVSPEDTRKSKKKHSRKHESDSEEDSSEEERRRRHKKKHRKSKSHKSSSSSRHSKKSKKYSSSEESSESENDRDKERAVVEVDPSQLDAVEDLWVEKKGSIIKCREK